MKIALIGALALFPAAVWAQTPSLIETFESLRGVQHPVDLTHHPVVQNLPLDQAIINGTKPTFAESQGLVGAPTVEKRRNYYYIQDNDNAFRFPFGSDTDLFTMLEFAQQQLYRAEPDEFIFIYIFTAFDGQVPAFFYAPEANDTLGIGTGTMDRNGRSPREGLIFMNYWRAFEQMFGQGGAQFVRGQARSVFNQEAGHRWGAFTPVRDAGNDFMLGRDDSHWSYFLHTGGSPMEGNAWNDNQNGTFTTVTGYNNWRFSDLDLYLMGLMPPTEVAPFFVIMAPQIGNQRDLYGQRLGVASPPQILQPVTLRGTRRDITIDEVTANHGLRRPAYGAAPNRWRVAFLMVGNRSATLTETQKVRFEEMVDDYALGFKEGTRNRGELDYLFFQPDPKSPIGGECAEATDCDPATTNYCLPQENAPGICSTTCRDRLDCPQNWCCQADALTTLACFPEHLCPPPVTPDAGVPACACDTSSSCDANCACDPQCTSTPALCACDLSYDCDMDGDRQCACDAECDEGCGCTSTQGSASALAIFALLLFPLLRRRF